MKNKKDGLSLSSRFSFILFCWNEKQRKREERERERELLKKPNPLSARSAYLSLSKANQGIGNRKIKTMDL